MPFQVARALASVVVLAGIAPARAQDPAPTPPAVGAPASAVLEHRLSRYEFEADGTGRRIDQARVRLNDASGVSEFSVLSFYYFGSTETCTLRSLAVLKPDGRTVTLTPTAAVEDVTVSGQFDERLFSDLRVKRVTVPTLAVGDVLSFDAEVRTTQALIPGHYWVSHTVAPSAPFLEDVLEIEAPAASDPVIHVMAGDADPTVTAPPGRRAWRWRITPKPSADGEPAELTTAVRVSTFRDWSTLAAWLRRIVDARTEPDAAVRAKAAALIQGRTTDRDKLTALYDFVAKEVRYISLSFGVGRYEPRAAPLVLSTLYGDCKDKHVLLASLARAVGLDVIPVLASTTGAPIDEQAASPDQFDHLISLWPAAGDRADVWLDSTTGVLPAGALFSQVRGHQVLPGLATGAVLVRPPARLPFPSSFSVTVTAALDDAGRYTATVRRSLHGAPEHALRLLTRDLPQAKWMELAQGYVRIDGVKDAKVTRAVIRDGSDGGLEIEYDATFKMQPFERSADWTFWLPTFDFNLPRIGDAVRSAGKPYPLGEPITSSLTVSLTVPATVPVRAPVAVSLARPFGTYRSTYKAERGTLSLSRVLQITADEVPADQLDAYDTFERATDADFRQRFAVSAVTRAPGSATPTDADSLAGAGLKALESRDYQKAVDLLTQATTLEPKHRFAWNNLGRAWLQQGQFDKAAQAFERQIAINAFDRYAYNNLGLTRLRQGRLDEALPHFRKQLEIDPLDKWAHGNLGDAFFRQERFAEAAAALEKAVAIDATAGGSWMLLGRARLALDQVPGAIDAFAQATAASPRPGTWNDAAWWLAEKPAGLDRATVWATKAIEGIASSLATVSLESLTAEQRASERALATFLDTLGWARTQAGDHEAGAAWLTAAWQLGQDPDTAMHLGRLEERRGRRTQAAQHYARAMAQRDRPEARQALQRVASGRGLALIETARTEIAAERQIRIGPADRRGTADVALLVDRSGRITAAHLVKGAATLAPLLAKAVGQRLPLTIPAGPINQVVRQASMSCGPDTGCVLVLPAFVGPR